MAGALITLRSGWRAKESAKRVPADADVEPKHVRPIQIRGVVKVAVVFDHDRGERHPALWIDVPLRVIEKEGVACTRTVGWPDDLDTHEGVCDVLDDGRLLHKPRRLLHGANADHQLAGSGPSLPVLAVVHVPPPLSFIRR